MHVIPIAMFSKIGMLTECIRTILLATTFTTVTATTTTEQLNEFFLLKCKWQEPRHRKKLLEIIHEDQDIKGSAFLTVEKTSHAMYVHMCVCGVQAEI